MLNQLSRYLKGYVRIRLQGYSPERFLNLCKARSLSLWDLQNVGNAYEMNLSIRDFRKIRPLCRKAHARVSIRERHGLPFFLYRNRKRKMFPIGIAACCLLLYLLSLFVWNIRIEGNRIRSNDVILDYLAEEGVVPGMGKPKVDCKKIQSLLRIHFPDVTWVSARLKGTELVIRIRENQDLTPEAENESLSDSYTDLVAKRDGVITGILVRSGTARVQPGAEITKGTLLISGTVELLNDNGDVTEVQEKAADGDVWARTVYPYEERFLLAHEERRFTGRRRYGISLKVAGRSLSVSDPRSFSLYTTAEKEYPLRLTESFYLPFTVGIQQRSEYKVSTEAYTKKEAEELARANLKEFLNNLIQKGVQIVENDVTIDSGRNFCVSKGQIVALEEIGVSQKGQKEQAALE